jgi:hypothetical protein
MSENQSSFVLAVFLIGALIGVAVGNVAGIYFLRSQDDIMRVGLGVTLIDVKYEGFSGVSLRFTYKNGTEVLVPITNDMKVITGGYPFCPGFEIKEIYSDSIGIRWIYEKEASP